VGRVFERKSWRGSSSQRYRQNKERKKRDPVKKTMSQRGMGSRMRRRRHHILNCRSQGGMHYKTGKKDLPRNPQGNKWQLRARRRDLAQVMSREDTHFH
jgi:hypothetical protein